MPLVKIEIRKGFSLEYKKAILDGVHQALVDALGIPDRDRFQRIYELDKGDFECPPDRSHAVTMIQITMFPGRSFEAKKKLYQNIIQNLGENPGIVGNDIMIILLEPPMENWGIRGGQPACEVDFEFKIDV
ncbi:tautomerase family protein [Methanobacterium sp.]|uniref:tautomerase family protein n=1 Tax=Methanobacterium sp. TaxID=2164 RepID=UPI0025D1514C|nr:tautomerase family protein [Methanobacterium sp.]MBI5459851.1 tautomerase family protein [Methanobacterium sp.]